MLVFAGVSLLFITPTSGACVFFFVFLRRSFFFSDIWERLFWDPSFKDFGSAFLGTLEDELIRWNIFIRTHIMYLYVHICICILWNQVASKPSPRGSVQPWDFQGSIELRKDEWVWRRSLQWALDHYQALSQGRPEKITNQEKAITQVAFHHFLGTLREGLFDGFGSPEWLEWFVESRANQGIETHMNPEKLVNIFFFLGLGGGI